MYPWPPWCVPNTPVWHHQVRTTIGAVDLDGIILEQRRRGAPPMRRRLTPKEAGWEIETGALRPYHQRPKSRGE
jgi:hypothetical protein